MTKQKYIDAEKLKAEIKKRESYCNNIYERDEKQNWDIANYYHGKAVALGELLIFIGSLQQEQQVDLKKEYDEYVSKDPVYSKLVNGIAGFSIAKHFFELGLKAKKGE